MSTYLQEQIKDRMNAKNLSVYALEKKARLNRSAVRNILQGFSKKPSAEVLMSIAEVLECSLDDLVGAQNRSSFITGQTRANKNINIHPWNKALYIDAIKSVSKCLDDKNIYIKSHRVITLINETYKYSLDKKSDRIDQDFTNWLVNKNL